MDQPTPDRQGMQVAKLIVRENCRAGAEPGCDRGARVRFSDNTTEVILATASAALIDLIESAAPASGPIEVIHIKDALRRRPDLARIFADGDTGFAVVG